MQGREALSSLKNRKKCRGKRHFFHGKARKSAGERGTFLTKKSEKVQGKEALLSQKSQKKRREKCTFPLQKNYKPIFRCL